VVAANKQEQGMDHVTWTELQRLIRLAVRRVGATPRTTYSDRLILTIFFWAVFHHQPLLWASRLDRYPPNKRPRVVPSYSQITRRVRTERFHRFLEEIHRIQTQNSQLSGLNFIDGKPLPVGSYSSDPDAKSGYAAGQMQTGYKLHAFVTEDRRIPLWSVEPMNRHEKIVAQQLFDHFPSVPRGSVFLADGNYDSHDFHKQIHSRRAWLFVKPRGMAKHPVTRRQMGLARRALIDLWERFPRHANWIYRQRIHVEGTFANLTSGPGGLQPLPSFVRRLPRVRRWVGAKIIVYHLRLDLRNRQNANTP
jgi:hypothetical protein